MRDTKFNTSKIIDTLAKRVRSANAAVVRDAAELAQSLAPVDTAYLHDHIEGGDRTTDTMRPTARLTSGAPYTVYVEHGTEHMAPQPFMRPAARLLDAAHVAAKLKKGE